ncbi:M56 family metallopeptidase [Sphingomonadaceae bacterium jetA1]|jgi:beta-lactamase regulating signal transducer with metallopeptidase domain|uniref:M56 family metallopeptidase n=1 Tax=Facivitalis istanbulensis TaxID=3075838 RepID=UPI003491CC36
MTAAMLGWAVEALIASGLLMALVLLLRPHVRRAFGPQLAYALWALPLLRLILPPLPRMVSEQATPPLAAASERFAEYVMVPVATRLPTPLAEANALPTLGQGIALLWALGATAFLAFQLIRHWRFRQRLLAEAQPLQSVEGVQVVSSAVAPGPLAFGVWRRYVAFPPDFAERYDADERDLALAHELGHHARGDLLANWIALAVLALHWFNPLAWRAFHAFRADQELANDARVLAGRSRADRHVYACAIVKAAHGRALSSACHLHTIDDLKGRLKMLTTSPASPRQRAFGGATVSLLVLAGLGMTASGTSAAAALTRKVERTMGVDLTSTAPVLPLPSVPPPAPDTPEPPATPAPSVTPVSVRTVVVPRAPRAPGAAQAPDAPRPPRMDIVTMPDGKPMRIAIADGVGPVQGFAIPPVRSQACGTSDGDRRTSYTIEQESKGQKVTIICTDRIQRAAEEAGRSAAMAERMAAGSAAMAERSAAMAERMAKQNMAFALGSIASARRSILRERNLSEDARKSALAGLDEAMVQVRNEMARSQGD